MLIKDNIDISTEKFKNIHRVNIFSDNCKYKFYIENNDSNSIKSILISDIGKLLKSIKNHTQGEPISKEELKEYKEGVELNIATLYHSYGQPFVKVFVEYPKDIYSYEKQDLTKYILTISGRPIFKKLNRYYSYLSTFTSNAGADKKINELVDDILKNILLDEIARINFYVCADSVYNEYYMYILFDMVNEDEALNKRDKIHQEKLNKEKQRLEKIEKTKEFIDNVIVKCYENGDELNDLYQQDKNNFEEKPDIAKEFNLNELVKLANLKKSNSYINYSSIDINEFTDIPEAFTDYVIGNNWYDQEITYIYLIKYKGHYYKSKEYISHTGSSSNWKGD